MLDVNGLTLSAMDLVLRDPTDLRRTNGLLAFSDSSLHIGLTVVFNRRVELIAGGRNTGLHSVRPEICTTDWAEMARLDGLIELTTFESDLDFSGLIVTVFYETEALTGNVFGLESGLAVTASDELRLTVREATVLLNLPVCKEGLVSALMSTLHIGELVCVLQVIVFSVLDGRIIIVCLRSKI